MRTKDILKEALVAFNGTVIVASHDREFLDGLIDKVYEFGNQQVREHLGGIYEFLERKNLESLKELEQRKTFTESEKKDLPINESKVSYEERKEQQRMQRRLEKKVEEKEKLIETLEAGIKEIEVILSAPEGVTNELLVKHASLQKQLDEAMGDWEQTTMELEKLGNN